MPRKNSLSPSHPKTRRWDRVSSYAPDTLVGQWGRFQIRKTRPSSTKAPVQLRRRASSQPATIPLEYPMTRKCGKSGKLAQIQQRGQRGMFQIRKTRPSSTKAPVQLRRRASSQPAAILFGVSDDPRMRPNAASWPRYNSAAKRHVSDTKKLVSATPVAASQLRVRSVCRMPPPQGNSAPPAGYLHTSALQPGIPDGWLRLPHPYSHSINGKPPSTASAISCATASSRLRGGLSITRLTAR